MYLKQATKNAKIKKRHSRCIIAYLPDIMHIDSKDYCHYWSTYEEAAFKHNSYFVITLIFSFPISAKAISIPDDISYVLVDSKTKLVIAKQHADMRFRPASTTTKIMTALIALESGDLKQEMNVSQQAVYDIGRGEMNVGIMAGEQNLTLENLLYVMLIKSANEAANIIAENIAPTRAGLLK